MELTSLQEAIQFMARRVYDKPIEPNCIPRSSTFDPWWEKMHGWGEGGDHIALIGNAPEDELGFRDALLSFGCHPPAMGKIFEHLRTRGRYDCVVMDSWLRENFGSLLKYYRTFGVEVEVVTMNLENRKPLEMRDYAGTIQDPLAQWARVKNSQPGYYDKYLTA
jgi:hypothetical protein